MWDLTGAVLGWLVADVGGAAVRGGRRLILGAPEQQALRVVVESAVRQVVDRAAGLDEEQREHLHAVLTSGPTMVDDRRVSSEAQLRTALMELTKQLDRNELGGPGYLSMLGLRADRVGEDVANGILLGIRDNARGGGPLRVVAEWFWRDEVTIRLDRLAHTVGERTTRATTRNRFGNFLPGEAQHFVGRDAALAELRRRIDAADGAGTMVSVHALTGMAGVGKTALAVRAAYQHTARFPDGQFFLDLYGYTAGVEPVTPETALEELLRQAGMSGQDIPAGLPARLNLWRRLLAGRRTLLVLDNAREVGQVQPLLPMTPGCLVLITSRSRLPAMTEASPLPVDVLSLPEAAALFVAIAGVHRCPDPVPVDRVVLAAGRLPLAVRIAAGRLRAEAALSVADVADELQDTRGRLDGLSPEQAGVRVAFAASVSALDQSRQRAFYAVGAYPGPTLVPTAFAAIAGVSVHQAKVLLRDLAFQHLIDLVASAPGEWPRYEMHNLVRDYARDLAAARVNHNDRKAAIRRLSHVYRLLVISKDWPHVVAERENLVAFGHAAAGAIAATVCLMAADRLFKAGAYQSANQLFRSACDDYDAIGDRSGVAAALNGLGHLARSLGDYEQAQERHETARQIYTEIGNRPGEASALLGLGHVAWSLGDFEQAQSRFTAAAQIDSRIDDQTIETSPLLGLGHVSWALGDYEQARARYEEARQVYTEIGNRPGEASALLGLGHVAWALGDYEQAGERHEAAHQIYTEIGNRQGEANTLRGLGHVAWALRDYKQARERHEAAHQIYTEIGNLRGRAKALLGLGHIACTLDDYREARKQYRAAYQIYTEIGNRLGEANALDGLGEVARATGRLDETRECWSAALILYERMNLPYVEIVRTKLAELDAHQ